MKHLFLALVMNTSIHAIATPTSRCKCTPRDSCWPTDHTWATLNSTVNGKLIKTEPVAASCYPGPREDAAECAAVKMGWTDARFQADEPVGLSYPINATCLPVTEEDAAGECTIGTSPRYAVNATCAEDVAATVSFARENNVRLVIKDTGHDILGRSTGYGSLEVWIRHLRTGLDFYEEYQSDCQAQDWKGSAVFVGGGCAFDEVYAVARQQNVVVVGGGTPTVGALGGWMQGGGHGPASRQFGLGADQVLEAQVALADGSIVRASACENADVFWAIRGGGPGTYGIVLSTTVRAHPMVSVQVQHVAIAPLDRGNTADLLEAVAILYEAYPHLNDAGYVHGFYTFDSTVQAGRAAFESTLARLEPFNMTSLFVSVDYVSYDSYWDFYDAESGVEPSVGSPAAMGSRLFSRSSVQDDTSALREMIGILAGEREEYTSNNFELVSGGVNFERDDSYSGLNPAWRRSSFSSIVARGWPLDASEAVTQSVYDDVVFEKQAAMERQAPDTGAYMNEASWADPAWKRNFYGEHYEPLLDIKKARDPGGVFFCRTCVGSDQWVEDGMGRLCRA